MARYLLLLPIFLALVALPHGGSAADDEKTSFEVTVEAENCKRKAKYSDALTVHYTGYVQSSGEKFDSSRDRRQPIQFQLGVGEVIKGWDDGLKGMCVGEKRRLKVPASQAYQDNSGGAAGPNPNEGKISENSEMPIPTDQALTFDIELLKIEDAEAPPCVFTEADTNNDRKVSRDEMFYFLKSRASQFGMEGNEHDMQHHQVVTAIFEQEDTDKDGYIQHKEFKGPKGPPTERDEL